MSAPNNVLLTIIQRYVAAPEDALAALKTHYGVDDLVGCWRSGEIPGRGTAGTLWFEFHGTGCFVQTPNGSVDFDFGADGLLAGFDEWKIRRFLEDNGQQFGFDLHDAFTELVSEGVVSRDGEDGLFTLAEDN